MSHNESFYMPEVDAYVQYTYIFWDAIDCIDWSRFHTERLRWDISNRILSIGGQQYEMPYSEKYFREKQMYDYKIATYKWAVVVILRAVTPLQLDYLWEPDKADMMGFQEIHGWDTWGMQPAEDWVCDTHLELKILKLVNFYKPLYPSIVSKKTILPRVSTQHILCNFSLIKTELTEKLEVSKL